METVIYRIAKKPWQSFLLQVIRLTPFNPGCGNDKTCIPVFGLLLDTSQYEKSRRLFKRGDLLRCRGLPKIRDKFACRTAGTNGEILQDQADAAVAAIERLRKENPSARVILFGHHDLVSLSEPTHEHLAKMITAGAQPLYVSAHTHLGFWKFHRLHDSISVIELNVGSLLDDPVHFRDFQLVAGSARNVVHSNAYLFSAISNNGGNGVGDLTCDSAWSPNKDVNTTRGQERVDLRDQLIPNSVKAFFKLLKLQSKPKASKKRDFFLRT